MEEQTPLYPPVAYTAASEGKGRYMRLIAFGHGRRQDSVFPRHEPKERTRYGRGDQAEGRSPRGTALETGVLPSSKILLNHSSLCTKDRVSQ